MSNGYTATPNIVAGALSASGRISSGADVVATSGQAELVHLASSGSASGIGFNMDPRGTTHDDAAKPGMALNFDGQLNVLAGTRHLAPNPVKTIAVALGEFLTAAGSVNTGNVTENTLYNTVLKANSLGNNGQIRLLIYLSTTVQGAGSSTLRVKLGSTLIASNPIASVAERWIEWVIANRANSSQQVVVENISANGVASNVGVGTTAIDTTADQQLIVTIQNANATDSHNMQVLSGLLLAAANGI